MEAKQGVVAKEDLIILSSWLMDSNGFTIFMWMWVWLVAFLCLNAVLMCEMDWKDVRGMDVATRGWFSGMMKLVRKKDGKEGEEGVRVELRQMRPCDCSLQNASVTIGGVFRTNTTLPIPFAFLTPFSPSHFPLLSFTHSHLHPHPTPHQQRYHNRDKHNTQWLTCTHSHSHSNTPFLRISCSHVNMSHETTTTTTTTTTCLTPYMFFPRLPFSLVPQ